MSKKSNAKRAKTFKDDDVFFKGVWEHRSHRCEECGQGLGDIMSRYFMAHILSKGSYPAFRHDPRNIVILCPDHHNQLDGKFEGKTKDDMRIAEGLEEIREELKQEYHERQ